MHRINSDGATPDNMFKETPAPATRVTATWLTAVQEEICNVITLIGPEEPDVADNAQMAVAIDFALNALRTAMTTDIDAGDTATLSAAAAAATAAISAALAGLVSYTAAATGQLKIGPIILKWGGYRETITDEVSRSVVFAEEYPNACWRVFPVPVVATAGDHQDLWCQLIGAPSTTGFSVQFQDDDSSDSRSAGFDWFAIGH